MGDRGVLVRVNPGSGGRYNVRLIYINHRLIVLAK